MGCSPLVRAATSVTSLWTSDQTNPAARHPFYDATTIFPDHVVGRITAIGALAALIPERRGLGARIHVSQAEAGINQLDTGFVMLAAESASDAAEVMHRVEHLVLPCAGTTEWCVVSITSSADRRAVSGVTGDAPLATLGRLTRRRRWPSDCRPPGSPAGPMNRPMTSMSIPQLRWRNLLADMVHPLFEVPLPAETGPARFATSRPPRSARHRSREPTPAASVATCWV